VFKEVKQAQRKLEKLPSRLELIANLRPVKTGQRRSTPSQLQNHRRLKKTLRVPPLLRRDLKEKEEPIKQRQI